MKPMTEAYVIHDRNKKAIGVFSTKRKALEYLGKPGRTKGHEIVTMKIDPTGFMRHFVSVYVGGTHYFRRIWQDTPDCPDHASRCEYTKGELHVTYETEDLYQAEDDARALLNKIRAQAEIKEGYYSPDGYFTHTKDTPCESAKATPSGSKSDTSKTQTDGSFKPSSLASPDTAQPVADSAKSLAPTSGQTPTYTAKKRIGRKSCLKVQPTTSTPSTDTPSSASDKPTPGDSPITSSQQTDPDTPSACQTTDPFPGESDYPTLEEWREAATQWGNRRHAKLTRKEIFA